MSGPPSYESKIQHTAEDREPSLSIKAVYDRKHPVHRGEITCCERRFATKEFFLIEIEIES